MPHASQIRLLTLLSTADRNADVVAIAHEQKLCDLAHRKRQTDHTVAPIVGRVTMDMTMVDVTEIPDCAVGDEVVLIGTQNGATLSALELSNWAETNAYEILCGIDARVTRVYHG